MGNFPTRRLNTSSRNSKENINKRKKIDRLLGDQSSSTLFMSVKDSYVSKKFILNTQDNLEEKIDRLMTMMNKLTAQDDDQNKQFKPKIYQCKRRGQTMNFYDRCDRNYPNGYRSDSRDRRISFSDRTQCRQHYTDRPRYEQRCRDNFIRGNFKGNLRPNQMYSRQNYRGGYRRNYRNENYERGRSRERQYAENTGGNDRSSSSRSTMGWNRYYWIQEMANPSCPNNIIYICYQKFASKNAEFK